MKKFIEKVDQLVNWSKDGRQISSFSFFSTFFLITEDELSFLECGITLNFAKRNILLNLYFYQQIDHFLDKCKHLDLDF